MKRAASLLATCAALATGCRVLPHDGPPTPALRVPDAWTVPPVAEDSEDELWWQSFEDPSLAGAVEEALTANLDLRTSATRVAAALAQARIAGAERFPSLGAGGSFNRQKQVFVGLPVPGGDVLDNTFTNYGVSLDLSWEVDLWGRIAATTRAAERDVVVAAQDHRAARHSIAAQTAKAWLAWQEAQLQLDLAERSLRSYEVTREVVLRRYNGGLVSAFDVRLAETDLATARARREDRHEVVERSLRQLELLLGRYPTGGFDAPPALPGVPPAPPTGVPGELIARRPDLAAAEMRLAAADDRLYAARAALYPRLTLTGSAGRSSDDLDDLTDSDFSVWSVAAGLTQPLFEGGRLRAGVDLADARVAEALAGFEAVLLGALGDVEIALVAERRFARLEDAQRTASEEAEAARLQAQDRYLAGLISLLDVQVLQRQALNEESAYLSVRRRRLVQRVDLHLALGGGFEEPQESREEED